MNPDLVQWSNSAIGGELTSWLCKSAGLLEALKEQGSNLLGKAEGAGQALMNFDPQAALGNTRRVWDEASPTVRNALTLGAVGAGSTGLLSAMSPSRPGEDSWERTMRIMRNAALGGAAAGGAGYLLPTGTEMAAKPRFADTEAKQKMNDADALFNFWPKGMGIGGATGAVLGGMFGRAEHNDLFQKAMASARNPAHLKPSLGLSRIAGKGFKGGLIGSSIGALLPILLAENGVTNAPASLFAKMQNGLSGLGEGLEAQHGNFAPESYMPQ